MNIKERIKELAKERGIGLPKVESDLKMGNGTILKWDKSDPSSKKLKAVADYFNVSTDYLLGSTNIRNQTFDSEQYYLNEETAEMAQELFENPELKSLFKMSRNMTPERLKAHIEFMKKLEEQENKH